MQQTGQLVDGEEAIVELDVVGDAEIDGAALEQEPVLLPLRRATSGCVLPAIRYSTSGWRSTIAGQRGDRRLDPLAGGDQPERREHEARPEPIEAP